MTVAAPWVRGIWEIGEARRIRHEDMVAAVRCALPDGETILNGAMEWKVDGEPTTAPLERIGRRLEVNFRVVVVRGE